MQGHVRISFVAEQKSEYNLLVCGTIPHSFPLDVRNLELEFFSNYFKTPISNKRVVLVREYPTGCFWTRKILLSIHIEAVLVRLGTCYD